METKSPFLNGDPEFLRKQEEERRKNLSAASDLMAAARARAQKAEQEETLRGVPTNNVPPLTAEQYINVKEEGAPLPTAVAKIEELTAKAAPAKPKRPWWMDMDKD